MVLGHRVEEDSENDEYSDNRKGPVVLEVDFAFGLVGHGLLG